MRKLKDLAVKTGTYQSNGETKNRYANVGALMEGDNGQFLFISRHINFAGLPFKEGSESVIVSMFDPRDNSGQTQGGQGYGSGGAQQRGGGQSYGQQNRNPRQDDLDDDVPF